MRVKFLRGMVYPNEKGHVEIGEILDVPEVEALAFLRDGSAEAVTETVKKAKTESKPKSQKKETKKKAKK